MKLSGRQIKGPNIEYIIIPRNDGDIILKAQAVLDMKEFDAVVKKPEPPLIMIPGGGKKADLEDIGFSQAVKQYANLRHVYVMLKSLSATEGLEWDSVDLSNPGTWLNFERELDEAGFTTSEQNMIYNGVASANGLNHERILEARNRFLASLTPQTSA